MNQPRPRVLDVGNCDPDHASIRRMLAGAFDIDIDRVMFVREAIDALSRKSYDLVLVNRLIFADGSDSLPLIEHMKKDERLRDVPVMMVSNFDDAQRRAMAAGAVRGFGKADLGDPATIAKLRPYLVGVTTR